LSVALRLFRRFIRTSPLKSFSSDGRCEGEVAVRGLDKKMIVVGHEAVCVADPIAALIDALDGVQEVLPVRVVLENRLFLVSPGGHVIDCAGIFYAEGARHEEILV
jgi:hypothetical protein